MVEFSHAVEADQVTIFVNDRLFVKQIAIKDANALMPQHKHEYDHVTLVLSGVVELYVDGVLKERLAAPNGANIEAGKWHHFRTLTPGVVLYCVHALDPNTGEPLVKEEAIPLEWR